MKPIILFIGFLWFWSCSCAGEKKSENREIALNVKSHSYKGLVMVGYQGWFNAEGDGAGRGWNHYQKKGVLSPGNCKFDFWPDMTEYQVQYKSPFYFEDGQQATLFSSFDASSVDLHFRWMKEYGIDGAFMQRFVTTLKSEKGYNHNQKVLESAFKAAETHDRIICIMYDLSGIVSGEETILIEDWKKLVKQYNLKDENRTDNYLCHNGKPLVVIWGAGFDDDRKYGLKEVETIVNFLKNDSEFGGFSVMLGVPTYWRTLKNDTMNDTLLHSIVKSVDIVQPWLVGRYNENTYPKFQALIKEDIEWCKRNRLDYVPVVFPGFSWHNMNPESKSDQIPRNKGSFFWKQLHGAISVGAEMIYVAMFDEIDEGTAIFKCAKKVPVGESVFVPVEDGIPNDYYLWLTGQAGKMLRKEIPLVEEKPVTNP